MFNFRLFKRKNNLSKNINPETCPHNEGYEGVDGGGAMNYICSRCGALVNNTPFGRVLLISDARKRFPEAALVLDVEKWKEEKKK